MRRKILVVDDETMMTELLCDHLGDEGYEVYAANSAREALGLLPKNPDLIILDINMPGMDGLELCKSIRDHISCPILFLTARITEQDKINGLEYGGDDYITKPFSLKELSARAAAHLRRFFLLSVLFTVAVVAALSGIVIWGCLYFRHWLLPDANAVYLTVEQVFADGHTTEGEYLLGFGDDLESLPELVVMDGEDPVEQNVDKTKYAVQKVENSYSMLTPKRKAAYQLCGVAMVAAPAFFAFAGILVCSAYFYRRKLKQPLELLGYAAKQIAGQDLDFEVAYDCEDEMGALCRSFEHMRRELCENHKAMWKMLEERRLLQASVAHDLRNPIAIIEGYAEYMEAGLKAGKLNREKLAHVTSNLRGAARRLEQYTESVRQLNQSEEEALERRAIPAAELAEGLAEDLNLLAEKKGVALKIKGELTGEEIQADAALIHRVLENIINNALRYARREICLEFALAGHSLAITVTDDGEGFSPEMLRRGERRLLAAGEDGHMGIGISASRLLCRKHGGSLTLSNVSGGACVKIVFSV